jgi:hypothetical protein
MRKTHRSMSEAEKRQLQHELKQMWDIVPPQELARARELAGVQTGKEHEFRIAAAKGQERNDFLDDSFAVRLRAELLDDVLNEQAAKQLNVQLQCGERQWQIRDGIYAHRFRSTQQLNNWLASIHEYYVLHLIERIRDTCLSVWDEALAKASNDHGVRKIDLTALREAQIKELRADKSKALSIKRGAKTGSKQSKHSLSKRQVDIDLPQYIRENGDETTRKEAAKRFGFSNEKAFDRALAQRGKRWRKLKDEAMMKIKKGH